MKPTSSNPLRSLGKKFGPLISGSTLPGLGAYAAYAYKQLSRRPRPTVESTPKKGRTPLDLEAFPQAVQLLQDPDTEKRKTGFYTLIKFADRRPHTHKQRVVDVLCDYLRQRDPGDKTMEYLILDEFKDHLSTPFMAEEMFPSYALPPAPLRKALQWTDLEIDFSGIFFSEPVDFSHCTLKGFNCEGAQFTGGVNFMLTKFTGPANFKKATFSREINLFEAIFSDEANFQEIKMLGSPIFADTHFCGYTNFQGAQFTDVPILHSAFYYAETNFEGAHTSDEHAHELEGGVLTPETTKKYFERHHR